MPPPHRHAAADVPSAVRVAYALHSVPLAAEMAEHQTIGTASASSGITVQVSGPQLVAMNMPMNRAETPLTQVAEGKGNAAAFPARELGVC
ncbi:hypothetical protein CUU62_20585 [Pseudomonas sp. WP001]|nr:hypothetical protein CUU62_20585 [Pseudomonas sp. WP001]